MSLSDTDPIFDKFFDGLINAPTMEAARAWLKQQPADEMKHFLNTYGGWHHDSGKRSLILLQLDSLASRKSTRDKWADRLIGFAIGILALYVAQQLGLK